MEIVIRAISSTGVLLMLIAGIMMFKRIGILNEEYGRMCSTLVTKVTLPALVFVTLIHADFNRDYGKMAVLLTSTSIVCLGVGWLIARAFRLDGPSAAPVILVCGFSSSSVLGVPLISELFPADKELIIETVVVSSLGMLPLIITGGTMIALFYGATGLTSKEKRKAVWAYFRSPIFIALVSGIVAAGITDHDNSFSHSILDGFRLISAGNTLMILLTLGLLVQLHDFSGIMGLAACVVLVNLIVIPLLMMPPAHAMNLPHWKIEVLALEGAMPAATLSVVLCYEYGANARLAAKLVFATIAASAFTVPVIFLLLGLF
jgi:predicted permease